jgi:hypothetical protein
VSVGQGAGAVFVAIGEMLFGLGFICLQRFFPNGRFLWSLVHMAKIIEQRWYCQQNVVKCSGKNIMIPKKLQVVYMNVRLIKQRLYNLVPATFMRNGKS